ncbi:MAG: ATP-binding protein [Pseudomonadota bacterium]
MEQVRNSALPWENTDLNTAEELRLSFANLKSNQLSRVQTQNSILAEEIAECKVIEDVLRETNRQLESFAYVASHDLQEPLRMVSNYCQLLERRYSENFEGKAREYLGNIMIGAKRMHQLIDSILEYSRFATRSQSYEAVDLNDICIELKNFFAEKLNSLNANFIIENLPIVFGEKNQLYQLIQNMISNGLKFHQENQAVIIKTSASRELDEFWKIAISDNGIGIPSNMQQKVFEMFQCLNPQKYEGTGNLSRCVSTGC